MLFQKLSKLQKNKGVLGMSNSEMTAAQKKLMRKILLSSGFALVIAGAFAGIFSGFLAAYIGGKDTVYMLSGSMIFVGIVDVILAKTIYKDDAL